MITVYTKNDLQKALKAKEKHIVVKGELAKTIKAKAKRKKIVRNVGIGTIAAGLVAIAVAPITGGASIATGMTAVGLTLTGGGLTISAGELALIIGGALGLTGLLKGYNVKFNSDGSVTIEK